MKPLVFELFAENQQNISDKKIFVVPRGQKLLIFDTKFRENFFSALKITNIQV